MNFGWATSNPTSKSSETMSSPAFCHANGSLQHGDGGFGDDQHNATSNGIPRRPMRVKILYAFDDPNMSNCLARLPNALSIPTASLDDTTEVGVIDLKTCIQAIVAASPELVAKLGHDYTVYAYDYSEYETPLVGQGMLSWILASISSTPNAPAHQSQTMVTGRVCKNILGLFSNGIKETLEVKLRLVPVPTCLQSEYIENMEKYRNLSKIMPEGFDYSAWIEFLKQNPDIGQLAQQNPNDLQPRSRMPTGGVESFHQMLTRPSPSEDPNSTGYRQSPRHGSFSTQGSRAPSPALSTTSYMSTQRFQNDVGSRPASRASVRNEMPAQDSLGPSTFSDQMDEGPARKRARVTQVKRPPRASFGANKEPLRVTASTAASVRLHGPAPPSSVRAMISVEQVPRAPTPRPGDSGRPFPHGRLPSSNMTSLRHGSRESRDRYVSPYLEAGLYSDNAADSADDERGASAGETPMEMPSSPPPLPLNIAPSAPSSPCLPPLAYPADSGFASDSVLGTDDKDLLLGKAFNGDGLSARVPAKQRKRADNTRRPWTAVTPGPMELLPNTRIPPEPVHTYASLPGAESSSMAPQTLNQALLSDAKPDTTEPNEVKAPSLTTSLAKSTSAVSTQSEQSPRSLSVGPTQTLPCSDAVAEPTPPVAAPKRANSKTTRPKGLAKSQTWSGEGAKEFFSDGAAPLDANTSSQLRSGTSVKRKEAIKARLEARLAAGVTPDFCNNCGEIETPTWRKAYTRVETGCPDNITLSTDGTGIVGFEILKNAEEDGPDQYRVFKQVLEPDERASESFQTLQLCNPCGLWFNKKGCMRPPEVYLRNIGRADRNKRKRGSTKDRGSSKKPKTPDDGSTSNAQDDGSHSNPQDVPPSSTEDVQAQPMPRPRASSFQFNVNVSAASSQLDETAAVIALRRAIQSSPVGVIGSKHSPIELEPDLTPKPTRRLLFPSPRKDGEVKLLGDPASVGLRGGGSAKVPKSLGSTAAPKEADVIEDQDKENCPPASAHEDDDLAELFEDCEPPASQITPSKLMHFEDVLKTPTPRGRYSLTPKRNADCPMESAGLITPTRQGRVASVPPMTPFSAQLRKILSDSGARTPQGSIDFSSFPILSTPGPFHSGDVAFGDFGNIGDDFLSSDLPLPSSSPGNYFSLYEDPATSTAANLWGGASIFDATSAMGTEQKSKSATPTGKTSGHFPVGAVDFTAIIRGVAGNQDDGGPQNEDTPKATKSA